MSVDKQEYYDRLVQELRSVKEAVERELDLTRPNDVGVRSMLVQTLEAVEARLKVERE